jgi:archaellum component FlaC
MPAFLTYIIDNSIEITIDTQFVRNRANRMADLMDEIGGISIELEREKARTNPSETKIEELKGNIELLNKECADLTEGINQQISQTIYATYYAVKDTWNSL